MSDNPRIIALKELSSTTRGDTLGATQTWLAPYAEQLSTLWTVAWVCTLAFVLVRHLIAPSWFGAGEDGEPDGPDQDAPAAR